MKIKAGFTLPELVISIVIINIAIISVALMYQVALRGSFNTKIMAVATVLLEEKAEEVLRLGYVGIDNATTTNTSFLDPFSDYQYQVTVHYVNNSSLDTSVDPTVTGYKNVEVRVTYSNIAPVIINSLLTNYTG